MTIFQHFIGTKKRSRGAFTAGVRWMAIGLLAAPMMLGAAIAQTPADCPLDSDKLLQCVSGLIKEMKSEPLWTNVVDNLKRPLEALASKDSYDGAENDLGELKRLSKSLKAASNEDNYEAILLLDNAIASHVNEIRPALSPNRLVGSAKPGTDIHAQFVQQKLNFLKSAKAEFYDGGPFELVRRALLIGALEDSYFLKRRGGEESQETLREQLKAIDDLIARYKNPTYQSFLRRQGKVAQADINNNVFWRATILFLLADADNMRRTLRELAVGNVDFGLETRDTSRQVYSYRVFNEPYKIEVQEGSKIAITDENLVKRFYNAAQLSLLMCNFAAVPPDDKGILAFKNAVRGLEARDHFVIVASAPTAGELKPIEESLQQSLARRNDDVRRLSTQIANESASFLEQMRSGAKACGVGEADLRKIYAPFEFKIWTQQIAEGYYLLIGGRLSAAHADRIVSFLETSTAPNMNRPVQGVADSRRRPYAARTLVPN